MTPVEHLRSLLGKFDTAMLVTQTSFGEMRARPMAVAKVDDDCRVWFLSSLGSGKVEEIDGEAQVNVVCQRAHELYVSLSGKASVTQNHAKIDELWNDSYKVWFPSGKQDPDIALISVQPEEGEYWDHEGFNKIKYLFEAARALAKGERPEVKEGEQHGKVAL